MPLFKVYHLRYKGVSDHHEDDPVCEVAPLTKISSPVDTLLFISIAFVATGLPWVTWAIGDYGAKLAMAAILLMPFRFFLSLIPSNPNKSYDQA